MTRQQQIFADFIRRMALVFERDTPLLDIEFAWSAGYYAGRDELLSEQIAKLKEPAANITEARRVRARCVPVGALPE